MTKEILTEKPKCFISYNQEDNDIDTIRGFVRILKEQSEDKIEILIDYEKPAGVDLEEYMDNIYSVEAIIVLLTPGYKNKADNRIKGGMYSEYGRIVRRLEEDKKQKKQLNST